ncbi:hypothetical protein [Thioflexithrix psekupsensis]|uniref:Uncharacterized protein n=1 Tax=Thioflexithrix psekupsensis TaxID=1570016 RepID=A0A251X424_9GAMM|nr:hypothetical protein [Thioflexithrix psekupsensis]OUD11711.1 hypothetical protein TPSD3_16805 [Thioflexithrix psekupsensis]
MASTDKDGHQVECPQVRIPLQSFGLEEPFVWLAQRCDEVDFARFQETAKKDVFSCMGKSQELLLRFPQESPYAQEIMQIGKNCQKKLMIGSVVGFFSLALVGLIAESVLDHFQLRQHLSNLENPKIEQTALDSAEIWLENYVNSPRFRHSLSRLTFDRENAKEMLHKLRRDREEQLWQTIPKLCEI